MRFLAIPALLGALLVCATSARAAPIWNIESEALPSAFQASDGAGNDAYRIDLENLGSTSSGEIQVVDHLPAGVTTTATPFGFPLHESGFYGGGLPIGEWACSEGADQSVVTCSTSATVASFAATFNDHAPETGASSVDPIEIPVSVDSGTGPASVQNVVTVSGGSALTSESSSSANPVNGAPTQFGTSFLKVRVIGDHGESFNQAAGHPWAVTTDFEFNKELEPGAANVAYNSKDGVEEDRDVSNEEPKTIVAELPLGLIGNPQAAPKCSQRQFAEETGNNINRCPSNSRVGVIYFAKGGAIGGPYQLFNLSTPPGHAAAFGFDFAGVGFTLDGDVVRSHRGYVLRITTLAPQAELRSISLTFFGDPAAAFETGERETPFLTNPVDCASTEEARTLQLHMDRWTDPGIGDPFDPDFSDSAWIPSNATLPPLEGCGALRFEPALSLQPAATDEGGTTQADEPSGYDVNLEVPQTESSSEPATAVLKTTTVTFPQGVSVSPSAANGLQACRDAQIALESNEPGSCPLPSQIGSAKVTTPLLESPLEGQLFLGEPECGASRVCTDADAGEGHIFRVFIQVHSQALGVTIKLPGAVKADPVTGRLTAEFAQLPQLPYSDVELKLDDGPRAALANPQTCGTFTTVSDLEPWSAPETATKVSESLFAITGCGSSLPFSPAFAAGTSAQAAGAYSPFSVTFSRGDGEQDLGAIAVATPPGLLGKIAGIPQCGGAEANAGTCSSASQIGTTTVSAGPGSEPYTITGGRVYLTGPYNGRPFGLSIVVPAVAGPFNLGNVVVRASIAVNPATAALTVASNPLPQLVDGVPIRLRSVTVEVDRPGFMLNATNCSEQAISATIAGEHPIDSGEASKSSAVSSAYAPSGCANLPFKPTLIAAAGGKGSKAGGSALDVKLQSAGLGQSNIAKLDLQIPKALSTRDSTLNKACIEAVFDANPAGCPGGSIIGRATVHTPLLNSALIGPAYLVSHGGAAFPDVELVLQGEGVELVLDGKTAIKKGITYSNFETTPDAPFTSFETELPTGLHSIFTANVPAKDDYSLCGTSLAMPTKIVGQNGAVIEQTTKVAVTGCKATRPSTRVQRQLANALKSCRRDKRRSKRARCERQARKQLGPKPKRHKSTNAGRRHS